MIIPSIGRTVHFVPAKGPHLPALITAVAGDNVTEDSRVTLTVFTGDKKSPVEIHDKVKQAEANKKPGTWHAPERV